MTSVTYEVQDKNNGWLPAASDNTLVSAPHGITGLDVTIDDDHIDVAYQAYYNGKSQGEAKNGEKIGDGAVIFQAVRILISPRHSSHIRYLVIDNKSNIFSAADDKPAATKSQTSPTMGCASFRSTSSDSAIRPEPTTAPSVIGELARRWSGVG